MEMEIAPAFPTLIGRFHPPESGPLNHELRRLVLEHEKKEPNDPHANVGGWHSRNNLLEWPDPSIQRLRETIAQGVQSMVEATLEQLRRFGSNRQFGGKISLIAWANVSRRGNYHTVHNHPGSCWSGVYYVHCGEGADADQSRGGFLDLLDPRPFTEMVPVPGEPYGQKISVKPKPGMMLIFPGFLYHFVHPFAAEGERISIAFNARTDRR